MRSDDDEGSMDQFNAKLDRGWDLAMRGDLDGARRAAERLIQIDGDSPEVHTLIGYIHAQEGDPQRALQHYQQALELDEMYLDAMLRASELLVHSMHDYEAGLKMADDALDLCETPDETADAMLLKFEAYLGAGDAKHAAEIVAELPTGPFESPFTTYMVGKAKFEIGDLDGAEPLLRDAATNDPDNPDVHYFLGLLLEQRESHGEATIAFLRARQCEAKSEPPPWSLPSEHFERRVQAALRRLPRPLAERLDNTLVIPADLPGVEAVADGVDPRVSVLADDVPTEDGGRRVVRLYIYQNNVERFAGSPAGIVEEMTHAITRELTAIFPDLATELGETEDDPNAH